MVIAHGVDNLKLKNYELIFAEILSINIRHGMGSL